MKKLLLVVVGLLVLMSLGAIPSSNAAPGQPPPLPPNNPRKGLIYDAWSVIRQVAARASIG